MISDCDSRIFPNLTVSFDLLNIYCLDSILDDKNKRSNGLLVVLSFLQQLFEIFHSYAVVEVLCAVQSGVVDGHELSLHVDDRRAAASGQCLYRIHQPLCRALAYGADSHNTTLAILEGVKAE